jgi:hypothetical protein
MSALDFLFQGQPPSSTTNYGGKATQTPQWLQDYAQGILSSAASVASQPYQASPVPQVAGFTPYQQQAQSGIAGVVGQYQPTLTQAQQIATGAANPSALSQATGYLPTASNYVQSALSPTQAMMNPYEQNVINQAKTQATQYWQNQLDPQINNQFTAAGQFGSSANQRAATLGADQITQNIQNTAQAALGQGYQQAQNAGLQAASETGALGQISGGLGYEQGVLGLQGANTLGGLAQTGQTLGLQGYGALDTAGLEQQQLNQQNLNVANAQFQQQQQYPYANLSWLQQMLSGTATPTTTPMSATGAETGYAPAYSASPISQALGIYSALNPSGNSNATAGGGQHG